MNATLLKPTIKSKCPKCGDPMLLEKDEYGLYLHCLCGKIVDLEKPLPKIHGKERNRLII